MREIDRASWLLDGVLGCVAGDSLRRATRKDPLRRLSSALSVLITKGEAARGLARVRAHQGLVILGPDAVLDDQWMAAIGDQPSLDFSGRLGRGSDPRRRTLEEDWFRLARDAADEALTLMGEALPSPFDTAVSRHAAALHLRLKTDIALRLRRLGIVQSRISRLDPVPVLILEGDLPMDDVLVLLAEAGFEASRVHLPGAPVAARRAMARDRGVRVEPSPDGAALARMLRRWRPRPLYAAGRVVVAADLRKRDDFRHVGTARALLKRIGRESGTAGATLLQPFTRPTGNTLNAVHTASRQGAASRLLRQPQATGQAPGLAPLRAFLLANLNRRIGGALSLAQRTAIAEGVGGFIISSLAPSLALCGELERSMRARPPAFAASVPLGSPFGALVVSAARAAGVPTVEVQTLMIGVSERDPAPIAERLAVLDTEQKAIFQRRFGVNESRFILAGPDGAGRTGDLPPSLAPAVVFASQPLDDVCVAAVRVLAEACERIGVPLSIAPHPDETDADLAAYRAVLSRHEALRWQILARGAAGGALAEHSVLATLVSNMAMWAAARGRDVLIIDVGVPVPLDFPRMGIALGAASPEEAAALLTDLGAGGPRSRALAQSRQAFFEANPQLLEADAARRIVQAMISRDE